MCTQAQLQLVVNRVNARLDHGSILSPDKIFLIELFKEHIDEAELGEGDFTETGAFVWSYWGLIQYESGRLALMGG